MPEKTVIDVLLHPVRLRIVRAFLGNSELTARDLAQRLVDVPQATLYRHVRRLVGAGVLTVTSETPVRGALERSYRIDPKSVVVPQEDIASIAPETHLKYFSAFLATLLTDFDRYIKAGDVDVVRDHVHYLQVPFFAGRGELDDFMDELQALIKRFAELGPAGNRSRRTISIVTLPESTTK